MQTEAHPRQKQGYPVGIQRLVEQPSLSIALVLIGLTRVPYIKGNASPRVTAEPSR